MGISSEIPWQASLLDVLEPTAIDRSFSTMRRTSFDPLSWVDYAPGWLTGSDALFGKLLHGTDWGQRSRHMYDSKVVEPRLTAGWRAESGEPLHPKILEEMRTVLSTRYGVQFDSMGLNLYRDGRDSVAWHGDRIDKKIEEPVVALVSLGHERKFMLRPAGGGESRAFLLQRGDLLVTGGRTQRDWEHSVPKVAQAGPRISIAFRHNMDPTAYRGKTSLTSDLELDGVTQ